MQITVSGHHLKLTDALKDYATNKLKKLEKHFNNITQVNVTLSVEKNQQKAGAEIHLAGKKAPLSAHHSTDDMYASIDSLTKKLERMVNSHKDKLKNHGNNDLI